jgi:glycosyltransferase involved in cell wall biosynthesis
VVSTRVDALVDAALWLIESPDEARRLGAAGRAAALKRYGLDRFLADWDNLMEDVTCASR